MIENALLGKSNFLGRDGFLWWIGQVAPRKGQKDQVDDGAGWGNRYKVRIQGYHPFNDDDIKYDDLPFAIALLPTTAGSGSANHATSTELQQGDIVFGFFLDGDEAQVPAILGHFSRNHIKDENGNAVGEEEYSGPFKSYTGFTETNPQNEKIKTLQSNEQNETTQVTNQSSDTGQYIDQNGSGEKVIPADTCTPSSVSRMAQAVESLSRRVEEFSLTGMALEAEIDAVADQVESMANGFVGRMMDATYDFLEPQLQEGLDNLYNDTFGKVFAQMGNSPQSYAAAHSAGRSAQVGKIPDIKNAENALACVANKVVEGLRGTVSDMLKDLLASGLGMAGCVGANFVGKFLGDMVNGIADAMKSPLSGLTDILGKGVDIAEFLQSSSFVLEDFSGFLDCGQTNKDKCPPIKKYEVAGGPMEKGADPFGYVMDQMNKSAGGLGGLTGGLSSIISTAQSLSSGNLLDAAFGGVSIPGIPGLGGIKGKFGNLIPPGVSKTLGAAGRVSGLIDELSGGGSCTGGKKGCGNPTMQIFGGGGFGAIGNVVLGKVIEKSGFGGVADGISKTASIIGVDLKVPGMNYKSPPAISFSDKCGQGYGAHGHAVLAPDGTIGAVVIDTVGEGYPVVTDPPENIGLTDIFIENPGTGYTPGDQIDEDVMIVDFPTGFAAPPDAAIPADAPELVVDPTTPLVPEAQRVQLKNATDKTIFDVVIDPETGGVTAVRVLNILKYEVPPVLKIASTTGNGAVLRPVFGEIPEAVQTDVITVVDCVGK